MVREENCYFNGIDQVEWYKSLIWGLLSEKSLLVKFFYWYQHSISINSDNFLNFYKINYDIQFIFMVF